MEMGFCIFCGKKSPIEVCKSCYNTLKEVTEFRCFVGLDVLGDYPFQDFDRLVNASKDWDLREICKEADYEIQFVFSNQEIVYLRFDKTNSLRLYKLLQDKDFKEVYPRFDNDSIYWLI